MLMPSIFGESLFDDFDNLMNFSFPDVDKTLYGKHAKNMMKTDVKETDSSYELDIDLPGYKKEDVNAKLTDGYLVISASTSSEKNEGDENATEENGKYIRRERFFGSCSRSFYVGEDITEEDIKARFENGVLKISVPKKQPEPEISQEKYIAIEG